MIRTSCPSAGQLPRPEVRAGAGFEADAARPQTLEKVENLVPSKLALHDYRARLIHCVHLKHGLSQIDADGGRLFHGWLPSSGGFDSTPMWHIAMPGAGAIHPISGGRRPSPSAKIAGPPHTCRPMASASGSSSFAELPTQSARVDRSRSMPSRPKIRLCRYNGRWSPYFETSTWASSPGPGRPRSIGREGSGAWQNASQQAQAMRGRTIRVTTVSRRVAANAGDVAKLLGDVLSDPLQGAAALAAGVTRGRARARRAAEG